MVHNWKDLETMDLYNVNMSVMIKAAYGLTRVMLSVWLCDYMIVYIVNIPVL